LHPVFAFVDFFCRSRIYPTAKLGIIARAAQRRCMPQAITDVIDFTLCLSWGGRHADRNQRGDAADHPSMK
jgi:hypothetical protein